MNDLAMLNDALVPSKYGEEVFDSIASKNVFLPRIQLFGSNSTLCKKGKITLGHYGIIKTKENVQDLTSEFNCLVIGWRPKALRIDGDNTKAWYNHLKPEFASVVEDSKQPNSGCMYGPEFLVYLSDIQEFATFFFGNPTFRRSAPLMKALIGKAATVASELIEKKKFSWHGPVITQCTAPLNLPSSGTPEHEAFTLEIRRQQENFNNPPEEAVEAATEETRAR